MQMQMDNRQNKASANFRTAEKLIDSVGYQGALRFCYAEQWLGVAGAVCTIRRRHRCQ